VHKIKEVMEKSANLGMQTFDQAIFDLYKAGKIPLDEALRNADSQNNLRLKISLSEGKAGGTDTNLTLQHDEPAPGEGMIGR
jgi:twitching motility protein PilU